MSSGWRKISITICLALIVLSILFAAFGAATNESFTAQSVAEEYNLPIGQSMFENQSILG